MNTEPKGKESSSRSHSIRISHITQDRYKDMVAFMDQLDLRDVVYFGHSDGAIIGLLTAMRTDRIGLLLSGSLRLSRLLL